MKLKVFTVNDIRMLEPRFDPVTGLDDDGNAVHPGGFMPEDWVGTALDVLKIDACPVEDRLWIVLNEGWIGDRALRQFALWCAREAQKLVDEHDPRSITVRDVAELFERGAATDQELTAARTAAEGAAWAAAWSAVEAARAARDAAESDAWTAAEGAAWSAARESQVRRLIEMLETDED